MHGKNNLTLELKFGRWQDNVVETQGPKIGAIVDDDRLLNQFFPTRRTPGHGYVPKNKI